MSTDLLKKSAKYNFHSFKGVMVLAAAAISRLSHVPVALICRGILLSSFRSLGWWAFKQLILHNMRR